jgi:hypothetical protein
LGQLQAHPPLADEGLAMFLHVLWSSSIVHVGEIGADLVVDRLARSGLERIKPIVEKINSRLGLEVNVRRMRGMAFHDVVSSPTLQRRTFRG